MAKTFLILAQAEGGNPIQWVFLAAMVAVMYLLLFRPQQKALKEHRALLAALKKGDEVITQGGLLGRIHAVAEREVQLEIAPGVKVQVLKTSIQSRRPKVDEAAAAKTDEAAAKKEEK